MEATYLRLFEAMRNRLSLVECGLKMIFGGFPVLCGCCGHSRYCIRKTEDRPKDDRARINQLPCKRIKLPGVRLLAEHHKPFDHLCKHPPRTHRVRLAAA